MRRKASQGSFEFPRGRGGARPGSGPKRKGARRRVSHKTRAPVAARFPVHVTVRVRRGVPSLRRKRAYRVVREAFRAGSERFGFRLNHYSVLGNHMHLIAEVNDRRALSRGMQGLLIRTAKRLNKFWDRSGSVFDDRYHDRILRTPREVRHALAYALLNARRHGIFLAEGPDPFSSGRWFDGWRTPVPVRERAWRHSPVAPPRTWLQRVGWRRRGLVAFAEVPGRQWAKGARETVGRIPRRRRGSRRSLPTGKRRNHETALTG